MSAVLENILTRRSCRSYGEKQLSEEQLELILKAGLWAPSGMNRQPWQFTVIQSPENLALLNRTVLGAGVLFLWSSHSGGGLGSGLHLHRLCGLRPGPWEHDAGGP
jgi:nitroreductase